MLDLLKTRHLRTSYNYGISWKVVPEIACHDHVFHFRYLPRASIVGFASVANVTSAHAFGLVALRQSVHSLQLHGPLPLPVGEAMMVHYPVN